MLNKFINAYKAKYFKIFSDDFYGRFKKFENELLEPSNKPSVELINSLKKLDLFICEPVQVAIIGQFSSGKSTFLNALLSRDILPTGVTPVTAKLTHIKYAPNYSLRVDYQNGRELSLDISEIGKFVDQRIFTDDIKEICIYAPLPILKRINFIDTPGLNSLSNADTQVTKGVIDDVCAVIWLSLIDNAARASELSDITEFLKDKQKSAICVLNQKDKLNEQELQNVLSHAKTTFGDQFLDIIAISAKQACKAMQDNDANLLQNSNFNAILECIEKFADEKIKENFVIQKCQKIKDELVLEYEYFFSIYEMANQIILNFQNKLDERVETFKANFNPKIELAFNQIKQTAKLIADEILLSFKPIKMSRYTHQKSLIKGENFKRTEYEMIGFDTDEIFSKLIYNDIKLAKIFRAYRLDLKNLEDELKAGLDEIYTTLESDFMIYKAQFEGVRKECEIHSDVEFAAIRTYAKEVYEMFLRDFENVKFSKIQKLSLFFEKLNLKVAANYENAIKIAVYFLKDKIDIARASYEKDPLGFSLFIPSQKEVFERVLTSLNLYEFENEMLSNTSFLNKISNELKNEFRQLATQKIEILSKLKQAQKEKSRALLDIKILGAK
ncbi:dynamin family protein [Campylobacter mucosalis]|uniref:GTP-binding protein (Dynamin domain) n=1 Tax=Campylobacter mucosalis CCUG 21559 TaxID=1032067 RepID=A0A6G5QFZ2_9BACT|nr:dynamin family protein [Campylobacter mucosalis]QCD44590.1 GTP-binding protein (dynamin domain) [Campylobacter mucosalis CCUG 21559]